MNIKRLLKQTEKFVTDNSPALLTSIGVAGTVGTAVLTGRASIQAYKVLEENREIAIYPDTPESLPAKEAVRLVWKLYIPPVAVGATTITAIVFANRIGTRRAAAIAAAYSVTEKAFTEYKDKVVEVIGEKKEEKLRGEIAQDRVNANPPNNNQVVVVNGDVLCMEAYTGRYFKSTYENIRNAENQIAAEVLNDGYASLGDFYHILGLPRTSDCEEMGWNTDKLPKIDITACVAADNKPCLVMTYVVVPIREYHRFR